MARVYGAGSWARRLQPGWALAVAGPKGGWMKSVNQAVMVAATCIPSDLTRWNAVGKPRRVVGDPVAVLKQNTRFIPVPQAPPALLKVPFSLFDPAASAAATAAGKLVFHCVGDTGGSHGTATEEAIATGMEEQITTAAAGRCGVVLLQPWGRDLFQWAEHAVQVGVL